MLRDLFQQMRLWFWHRTLRADLNFADTLSLDAQRVFWILPRWQQKALFLR